MTIALDRSRPTPKDLARVRRWASELLDLGDDNVLVVTELTSEETGSAAVETVIAVLGPKEQRHAIDKAARDVCHDDVVEALVDGK